MEPLQPKPRPRGGPAKPATAAAPADGVDGVSEFTQLALWMAASVAGLVTALLVARRPFFEAMLRRVGHKPDRPRTGARRRAATGRANAGRASREADPRPTAEESLPMLADAIVGNTKAAVASVFGPPRSAAVRGVVKSPGKSPAFWQASTWYYPLPRNDALAMAIEFDDDAARKVEFFRAPGL